LITGQQDDGDSIALEVQLDLATHTISYVDAATVSSGSIQRDGTTVATFTGVKSPGILTFIGTASTDHMLLRRGTTAGTFVLSSSDAVPTFFSVTFQEPADSLTLQLGAGDDSLAMDPNLFEPSLAFQVDGGTGTDSVTLNSGSAIGGLTDGNSYSVLPDVTNSKKLQLSGALATAVDLTTVGVGSPHALLIGTAKPFLVSSILFDSDTLVFATAHGFSTGDALLYDNGGSHSIQGLVSGGIFYAIKVSDTQLQLADTKADALRETPVSVNLQSPLSTSVSHTLRRALPFDPVTDVDLTNDTITFADAHGLSATDTVTYRVGGKMDDVTYSVVTADTGLLSRDDMGVGFRRVESVEDDTIAGERTVRLTADDDSVQVSKSSGKIIVQSLNTSFPTLTVTKPLYYLTLNPGDGDDTVVVQPFAPGSGFTFTIDALPDTDVQFPGTATVTDTDSLTIEVAAGSTAQSVSFTVSASSTLNGSVSYNGDTLLSYTGFSDSGNVIVHGTSGGDAIQFVAASTAGNYEITSGGTFSKVTVGTLAGILTIDAADGVDSLTIGNSLTYAGRLVLLGGSGADTLTIAGTITTLTYGSTFETVSSDTAAVSTRTYVASSGADIVTLAHGTGARLSLTTNGVAVVFNEPTTSLMVSTGDGADTITVNLDEPGTGYDLTAALILDGGAGTDSVTINGGKFKTVQIISSESTTDTSTKDDFQFGDSDYTITVSRAASGKIQFDYTDGDGVSHTLEVTDPVNSLTIESDITNIMALSLTADLTVTGTAVTVMGDLTLAGQDLSISATTINVNAGVTVATRKVASASDLLSGNSTGNSGDITLSGRTITIGTGAKLLAQGSGSYTAGAIAMTAAHKARPNGPFINLVSATASITLLSATLKGGVITIHSNAAALKKFSFLPESLDFIPADVAETLLGTLLNMPVGVVLASATSTISIGTGSTITATSVDIDSQARTNASMTLLVTGLGVIYLESKSDRNGDS
jgi:hypothetical protein